MKAIIAVLLCIVFGAYSQQLQASPETAPDSLIIWVNGACGMYKTRIEKAALTVRGGRIRLLGYGKPSTDNKPPSGKVKSKKLHYKIASVGHDREEMLAPDQAHLHGFQQRLQYSEYP